MNRNIPKRRFKGFTEPWKEKKLDKISHRLDNQRIPISENKRIPGNIPYYGANGIQDFVRGYTHDGEHVLLAEDGANDLIDYPVQYVLGKIWVNNHAHVLKGKENILDNKFLYVAIKNMDLRPYLVGGGRAKLNADIMMNLVILIPPFEEQKLIGSFFKKLDDEINLEQKKLEKLKNLKKAYLSEMFPAEGELFPKRRFKGFTEPWEESEFDKIFNVSQGLQIPINKRFLEPGDDRYFYITNEFLKENNDEKFFIENPSKNVLCNIDDILITRTGNTGIIVSDVEGCFHNNFFKLDYDKNKYDKKFLVNYLSSDLIQRIIIKNSGGSTIPDLSHKSFYSILGKFPTIEEQKLIGAFLKKLDNEIYLEQKKLEKLKQLKQAYLEEMFV